MSRQGRSTGSVLVSLLLVGVFAGQACGGPPPAPAPTPAPTQASPSSASPATRPEASPTQGDDVIVGNADGKLLSDAGPVTGPAAEVAKRLAGQVLAGDEAGLRALVSAVSGSGIAIGDLDRSLVVAAVEPAQGITFLAGQLIAMNQLEQRGQAVPIGELGTSIASLAFGRTENGAGDSLGAALVDEVRTASKSKIPTVRAWALFVAELGRQGTGHYDMLDTADTTPVVVDTVQASFLLARLAGHLAVLAGAEAMTPSLALADGSRVPTARLAGNLGVCDTLTDVVEMVSDVSDATLGTSISEALKDWLSKGLDHALKVVTAVWGVLNYMLGRMIMDMSLDIVAGDQPLVRTKSTSRPGEGSITVRATVKIDSSGAAYARCIKHLGAAIGIGVDLNVDGALKDGVVEWHMTGDSLEWAKGECKTGTCQGTTDGKGQDSITIEGAPQQRTLPVNPPEAKKTVTVSYRITAHHNPISDAAKLFPGAWAQSGWMTIDVALEVLQRMGDRGSSTTIAVKDWSRDWPPFIRLKATGTLAYSSASEQFTIDTVLVKGDQDENGAWAVYRAGSDNVAIGSMSGSSRRPLPGGGTGGCVITPIPAVVQLKGSVRLTRDPKLNMISADFKLKNGNDGSAPIASVQCTRGTKSPVEPWQGTIMAGDLRPVDVDPIFPFPTIQGDFRLPTDESPDVVQAYHWHIAPETRAP